MHHDAQQHNWISTKTIILAQQAKEASTCKINQAENKKIQDRVNKLKSRFSEKQIKWTNL